MRRMSTPSLSLEAVLARIDALPWATLPGDRDDLARLHESLVTWVRPPDAAAADDACDVVVDLAHYIGEIDEAADALLPLALDLLSYAALARRESLVDLIDQIVRWGPPERRERARDGLAPWLRDAPIGLARALVRLGCAIFGDVSITPPWRDTLEAWALDLERETRERAAAIIALARARAAGPVVERLLAAPARSDVSEALAFALRLSGAPLTAAARAHVEAYGQPGQMAGLYARTRLPSDIGRDLPPFERAETPLEPTEVVFAGAALVQVKHATRGSFTLRIPGQGLAPGATVWIGDIVAPPTNRPLRVEWKVGNETHRARFGIDGQRVE